MSETANSTNGPAAPSGVAASVDTILGGLDMAAKAIIVVAIGAMVMIVAAQAVLRYATSSSIGWADEVSRLAFVASVFLAVPIGIRTQSHIGIELLTARLPALAQSGLMRIMALLSAVLMVVVAFQSAKVAIDQWDERMASLEFSAGWFLVPVAVGAVHSTLHLVRIAIFGQYRQKHHITALE